MRSAIAFVILSALGFGVCLGKWWEHDRPGGVADLEDLVDNLEADNALLRGERDQRRNASMAMHPSSQTGLRAVREAL